MHFGKALSSYKQYKGEQEYEERKFKSPTNENYRTTGNYS